MLSNSFSFCCCEVQTALAIAFLGAVEFTVVCKYSVLHLICFCSLTWRPPLQVRAYSAAADRPVTSNRQSFWQLCVPAFSMWANVQGIYRLASCGHSPCATRCGKIELSLRKSLTEDLTAPKCVHPKEGCTKKTWIEFLVMELGHRSLSCSESRVRRRNSRTKRSRIFRQKSCLRILWNIVSCYGWSCAGIVPCAVAGVGTKRMLQDVSYAHALGPFRSSAFFFCSLLMVGASVVFVSFSDQAPPCAGISFAPCRELSGLHCDEDRARVLWLASLLQQHLLHAVGMRWDGTGSRQQFLRAWLYSQQRRQPGLPGRDLDRKQCPIAWWRCQHWRRKRPPELEPEGQSYKKYTDKGSRRSSANQQSDSCFRPESFALSGPNHSIAPAVVAKGRWQCKVWDAEDNTPIQCWLLPAAGRRQPGRPTPHSHLRCLGRL